MYMGRLILHQQTRTPRFCVIAGFLLHYVCGKCAEELGARHLQLDRAALISRSNSVFFN